jgi:hypothetical protein
MPCQKYREMEAEWRMMGENRAYHDNKVHDDRRCKERQKNLGMSKKLGTRFSELNHQMALHRATCPDCKDVMGPPANLEFSQK